MTHCQAFSLEEWHCVSVSRAAAGRGVGGISVLLCLLTKHISVCLAKCRKNVVVPHPPHTPQTSAPPPPPAFKTHLPSFFYFVAKTKSIHTDGQPCDRQPSFTLPPNFCRLETVMETDTDWSGVEWYNSILVTPFTSNEMCSSCATSWKHVSVCFLVNLSHQCNLLKETRVTFLSIFVFMLIFLLLTRRERLPEFLCFVKCT